MRTMTCLMGVRVCSFSRACSEVASGPPRLNWNTVNAMNPTRRLWRVFETVCFRDMQSPFLNIGDDDFNGRGRDCTVCITMRLSGDELRIIKNPAYGNRDYLAALDL